MHVYLFKFLVLQDFSLTVVWIVWIVKKWLTDWMDWNIVYSHKTFKHANCEFTIEHSAKNILFHSSFQRHWILCLDWGKHRRVFFNISVAPPSDALINWRVVKEQCIITVCSVLTVLLLCIIHSAVESICLLYLSHWNVSGHLAKFDIRQTQNAFYEWWISYRSLPGPIWQTVWSRPLFHLDSTKVLESTKQWLKK